MNKGDLFFILLGVAFIITSMIVVSLTSYKEGYNDALISIFENNTCTPKVDFDIPIDNYYRVYNFTAKTINDSNKSYLKVTKGNQTYYPDSSLFISNFSIAYKEPNYSETAYHTVATNNKFIIYSCANSTLKINSTSLYCEK